MADQLKSGQLKRFRKNVAKAQSKDSMKAFNKLVRTVDGRPRLVGDPPLIVPLPELFPDLELHQLEDALRELLRSYRRSLRGDHRHLIEGFRFAGAARKVVGVGSVGTRAWIVLMLGNDDGDPLLLQAKEAQASVLEPFLGKSKHANHGQRVVEGQRLMQSASDVLLGWIKSSGLDGVDRDYYVRQLWDGRARRSSRHEALRDGRRTPGCAAGPWPGPMPGPATRSRSRATSAPATGSTARSRVRRGVRRPERARLRRAPGGRRVRARQGSIRHQLAFPRLAREHRDAPGSRLPGQQSGAAAPPKGPRRMALSPAGAATSTPSAGSSSLRNRSGDSVHTTRCGSSGGPQASSSRGLDRAPVGEPGGALERTRLPVDDPPLARDHGAKEDHDDGQVDPGAAQATQSPSQGSGRHVRVVAAALRRRHRPFPVNS